MGSTQQHLSLLDGSGDDVGIFNPTLAPLFAGTNKAGIDWLCPGCDTVLAIDLYVGQLFDLGIRCPKCEVIGIAPKRPPGQAIPAAAVVPPGRFLISDTINIAHASLISEQTLADYSTEVGIGIAGEGVKTDPTALREFAQEIRELLGVRYEKLQKSDLAGKASKTPPSKRHPLIVLIEEADTLANNMESNDESSNMITIDGDVLAELLWDVVLFRRWKNHPAFPELIQAITDVDEVRHTTMLLLVASYLTDSGNGVEIVYGEHGDGRIPDLRLRPSLTEYVGIELKTPQAFRAPKKQPIEYSQAVKEIELQLDKAASSKKGQLDPSSTGIVTIGAYSLSPESFAILKTAAAYVLQKQHGQKRKSHVAGVFLASIGWEAPARIISPGQTTYFSPTCNCELIQHPGYQGNVQIGQSEMPTFNLPTS